MSSEGRHLGDQCRHRVGWVFVAPRRNVRPSPPSKMDWFVNAKMKRARIVAGGAAVLKRLLVSGRSLHWLKLSIKKGEEKPLHHDPLQMLAL